MDKHVFGFLLSTLLSAALLVPADTAAQTTAELAARILALETPLANVRVIPGIINGLPGPHIVITGANLHIRSGSRTTDGTVNGTGNLIVGYNEVPVNLQANERNDSHNLIVGPQHNYSSF